MTSRRVAFIGAGVVGQVYAGRLADAGHSCWLLARGDTLADLRTNGLRLESGGVPSRPQVQVVASPTDIPAVDVVYLAVRSDQVDSALPVLAQLQAPVVVTLVNLAERAEEVAERIGRDRIVLGFPGVGGVRTPRGVTYVQIPQQHTTLGRAEPRHRGVAEDLRSAGFAVDVVDDPVGWLATHTVFIAGVGAGIIGAGGAARLGSDRVRTARMVRAVGDGFRALSERGVSVTPRPLRLIFTTVPRLISVPYWQRQMRGELGRVALEPHILATQHSEFPLLAAGARTLTDGAGLLDAELAAAGFPARTH